MPLTDEEAIALAVLDGMECVCFPDRKTQKSGGPIYDPRTIYDFAPGCYIFALKWGLYKEAPDDLRGGFNSHGELAQAWCKWKGLS